MSLKTASIRPQRDLYGYKVNDIDYHFSNVYQKLPGDGIGV